MTMPEELWILVVMAGVAVFLAIVALVMFAPPRPSVPSDGPIRISIRPFKDLEPDPEQTFLGDAVARALAQSMERYERLEASVGDSPARFMLTGTVRKRGARISVQSTAASDGRRYWSNGFDVKLDDLPKAVAKAVDGLAKQMKTPLK